MSRKKMLFWMTLTLIGCIATLPGLVQGQTFNLKWGANGSGNGQFNQPTGIMAHSSGNIYVADFNNHRVQIFNSSGVYQSQFGGFGSGDGQLNHPKGLAEDASGNIYVVDSGNARIQKFNSSGGYISKFGSFGSGPSQFDNPQYIGIDSGGNIYIADPFNHRVQKFNSGHAFQIQFGSGILNLPIGLAVDGSDNIYVTSFNSHLVHKFNSGGGLLTQWGGGGSGDGQFLNPHEIAVDSSGDIYVTDNTNHRVQKFTNTGGFISKFGSSGSGDGQFNQPNGIAVDPSDNIYVADHNNHRVQKFSVAPPTHTLTATAGANGSIAPPGATVVNAGANQSYTITPDVGYHIADVLVDGGSVGAASTYDFLNVQADHTISATFAINTYDITATAGANGSIAPPGVTAVNHNANQSYTITPDAGYHIDDVLVDGGSVGAVSTYDFIGVQANHTITASFALTVVTISAAPPVTATYNQALTVPVTLSDASGILAAELTVEYDTALLTLVGASSTGTLTDGWSVETNTQAGAGTLEQLVMAMATDVNAVTGPATLINLDFTVNDVRAPAASALALSGALLNDGNPPNVTVDGSVTLVGNDATIVFSSGGSPIPRESITVVVTDADADLTSGPGNDNVSVTITNLNNGDVINASFPEDGALAGTFSLVVPTEFGLAAVVDATIQAQAGDDIDFTFVDQLDSNGNGPIPRTILANVIGGTDGTIVSTIVTQPGDLVYIRVTDADLNTDDLLQESVVVTALSSTTESENNIVLTEDGIDSDIFFGSVATTTGAIPGPNNDGPFHTQKGDVLTITYDDVVTAVGDQLDRVDDDEVVDPFGDADGNGQTQAFDAAKVLLHSLSPFLTGLDSLASNVDALAFDPVVGKITPFDAALVLKKRVGLIAAFPVQADTADNHPQPETDNSVPKALPDLRLLSLQPNGDYLSVWADDRAGILSGDVLIEDLVGQVEMAPELSNFLSASQVGQEGLHIVFAGAQEVSGPGELMRIYPGVGPDKAQLTRAQFNDGRIVGRVEALATPVAIPASFVLHANYPNPFNPETTIAFDLPQAGNVELQVFDLLGQTVRTLVAQELSAGGHQVVWNGLDASGARVSSGVYFYRLQAGSQVQMRRMLLLK